MNGAERISDVEGKAATDSGERAGKRSEFQIRLWSLGGSFFHLSLRFPNLFHRGVMLLVKGECESQLARVGVAPLSRQSIIKSLDNSKFS